MAHDNTKKIQSISKKRAEYLETIAYHLVELENVFIALESIVLHRTVQVRGEMSKEKWKRLHEEVNKLEEIF